MYPAPLITTKLHAPLVVADQIPRSQLFQSLEHGLQVPLILVSAPPGFGKSMLMASWSHTHTADLQTAWLSLDEGDNEPTLFWRYFIAALQSVHQNTGKTIQAMLSPSTSPGMQTILTQLINELSTLESSLLLVLDDYHVIQSQSIHGSLKFFIDHLPPNIHLALLTREDPPLGLARRRARRQMVEIRASDLRFNNLETTEFLNGTHKLHLSREQIALLEERTEGWVTALQLAALSIQGRDPTQFFEMFAGDDRYIADYLIEEVLQRQPESVRAFLLKTSILERLSPSLGAAVTGEANARDYLYRLEQGNLFLIPLDNHREWYRYHHLFAELLRLRLRETYSVEEIARLHRIASTWYESQREIPAAIRHAQQIPDELRVWQLLERYAGTFYEHGTLPQLFELANTVSPAQRETSPGLCAAVAWAALASNHFEAVDDWLTAIEHHFSLSADAAITNPTLDPNRRAALLEVLIIRLQLPTSPQTAGRILAIRDQLNSLSPDQPCLFNVVASLKPVINFNLGLLSENNGETVLAVDAFTASMISAREKANWHLYHLARAHLAGLQMTMGHLHIARQTYEQGLTENTIIRVSPYLSLLHAGLGLLLYEWNDLPTAEHHFNEGLALARLWNQWESRVPIILGLAHLKQRSGEFEQALHLLAELEALPLENMSLPVEAYAALLRFLSGDQIGSAAWLATKMESVAVDPIPANESGLLDVARLMILLQQTTDARALLEKICATTQSSGRMYIFIRAKVILSKVFAVQGQVAPALACLLEAVPLASAEGYISIFVDEGETMRQLLHETRNKLASSELRSYVDQLIAVFGSGKSLPVKQEAGYGAPELSEREREILVLVAAGLSNQEIAERLVISITTVKTHVGNIFKKLGVTSRIQAIARAQGLGLLPPR